MTQSSLPTFSSTGYREVLSFAHAKSYKFVKFRDKDTYRHSLGKFCLMRHDIDVSLKCALDMAEVEADLGVCATYFFMLSSPAYNLFSRYAYMVLQRVKALGHEVALHHDAAHPIITDKNLEHEVLREANIISDIINDKVYSVSFHQPSPEILKGDTFIPGLINTYNRDQMKDWYYSSDSNRIWKEHNALSVFSDSKYDKVQLLIHPIWWMYDNPIVEDAWDKAIIDNCYIMQEQFLATETAYGSARQFEIKRDNGYRND